MTFLLDSRTERGYAVSFSNLERGIMQKQVFALLAVVAVNVSAQNEGIVVEPIQFHYEHTVTLPSADDLPVIFRHWNWNNTKTGCKITYVAKGKNIIDITTNAFTVTSITSKDGKDLLEDKDGWGLVSSWEILLNESRTSNWYKLLRFKNEIPNDLSYVSFTLFVTTPTPMLHPNVKGTVNIRVAGKIETETLTLKADEKGKEQKVGPLTLSVSDSKFNANGLEVSVRGDGSLLSNLTLMADGKKSEQYGSSSSSFLSTYTFRFVPGASEYTLSVSYFADIKEVAVPFGEAEPVEKF